MNLKQHKQALHSQAEEIFSEITNGLYNNELLSASCETMILRIRQNFLSSTGKTEDRSERNIAGVLGASKTDKAIAEAASAPALPDRKPRFGLEHRHKFAVIEIEKKRNEGSAKPKKKGK